jgi:hypothetical protein
MAIGQTNISVGINSEPLTPRLSTKMHSILSELSVVFSVAIKPMQNLAVADLKLNYSFLLEKLQSCEYNFVLFTRLQVYYRPPTLDQSSYDFIS